MVAMKIKDCCTVVAGQSPESKYYNTDGIGIPFFQGKADFGELYPTVRVYCSQPTKITEKDDILLSVRAPVGATNLAPGRVCIGRGLTAIRPSTSLDLKYLLHYFRYFEVHLQTKGTGTTFKAITQDIVKNISVPVPPLPEQRRIVARIEELFSKLDSGIETLKKTKQQLAVYRQSVLKAAFANITEKKTIREMSSVVTSGSRGWAQYYSERGAIFVRIGNLTRNHIKIDLNDVQYVELPDDAEGRRTKLRPNDVLVSITADLGSIGFVPYDIGEAYVNQHIAMIRFNNPSQGKLMAWYLRSDFGQKDLLKNKRGGGKLGLGLDDIRDSQVPVISDVEADRILSNIESRFSVCDSIEKSVDAALQQTESMRQSILKKAFEGKF